MKFWDGFEIMKTVMVKKEMKIGLFQEVCRREYIDEYPDFKGMRGEFGFLCVVGGIIMPTSVSFYELLQKELKSRTGERLFNMVKRDGFEEHVGEPIIIIDKRIFDANKHIFPLKLWTSLNMTLID